MLVDREILAAVEAGAIVIDPFDREALGTNSYDVHLSPTLRIYRDVGEYVKNYSGSTRYVTKPLDVREKRETVDHIIGPDGFVLQPDELYLASTIEYTESHAHVPILNGKSGLGRLGLSIHVTAGTGDVGFCNHWTMELFVVKPLRIYAGMPVGQLLWHAVAAIPLRPYNVKPSAKYGGRDPDPRASEFWRNFDKA
jgi:dCTP deaminase